MSFTSITRQKIGQVLKNKFRGKHPSNSKIVETIAINYQGSLKSHAKKNFNARDFFSFLHLFFFESQENEHFLSARIF